MGHEGWVVERESPFIYGVWIRCGPAYVSEEVARLAVKYHWLALHGPHVRWTRVA